MNNTDAVAKLKEGKCVRREGSSGFYAMTKDGQIYFYNHGKTEGAPVSLGPYSYALHDPDKESK